MLLCVMRWPGRTPMMASVLCSSSYVAPPPRISWRCVYRGTGLLFGRRNRVRVAVGPRARVRGGRGGVETRVYRIERAHRPSW